MVNRYNDKRRSKSETLLDRYTTHLILSDPALFIDLFIDEEAIFLFLKA
jgi:hypothetical protein